MHPPPRIYASATRESKTNTITSPLSRSFSPPSFPPPSPSLSPPSLLTYNIRSLSFYSTDPQSLTRRLSISHAIKDFIKSHDIICLQETHLAHLESFALSSLSGCVVSRNNLSMSSAGTLIIDTPAILRNYQPADVALPAFAKGHVQLRRYTPTSPHSQPFQVFNAYFKSGGDFGFNHRLLEAMLTIDNDIDTYLCGDLNFLESPDDTTSASPLMPPASFAAAWSNFKLKFNLFDLPSDTHTFFHLTSNPLSPYSWSSRLDHILFPAYLASHPMITPSTTIPHHSTNLNVSPLNSRSSFSDHLPLHLTYSANTPPPPPTPPPPTPPPTKPED
jgi:exonuclease III